MNVEKTLPLGFGDYYNVNYMSVTSVTKEFIKEISVSEIDFDLRNEFKKDVHDDDEEIDFVEIGDYSYSSSMPINIQRLEEILKELKEKGSTHVEIDYDGDHYGYKFAGFKIFK